jgi:WD40 repeat protein
MEFLCCSRLEMVRSKPQACTTGLCCQSYPPLSHLLCMHLLALLLMRAPTPARLLVCTTERLLTLPLHVTAATNPKGRTDRGLTGITKLCATTTGELVSAGKDGKVVVWDVDAREPKAVLAGGHSGSMTNAHVVASVCPLAGGGVVSTGWDTTAVVWDVPAAAQVAKLAGHPAAVLDARGLVDGGVVTACGDGNLRVFSKAGLCTGTHAGHTMPVRIFQPFPFPFRFSLLSSVDYTRFTGSVDHISLYCCFRCAPSLQCRAAGTSPWTMQAPWYGGTPIGAC